MADEIEQKEFSDGRLKTGACQKISVLVKSCVANRELERFNLDEICRHLQVSERQNRQYVSQELGRLVEQGKLEKLASGAHYYYKYVNTNKKEILWYKENTSNLLSIRWPCSHLDASEFDFEHHLIVSQGDLIVVAGVSNMGKTAFAHNFLFENMHTTANL
jgi:replicative DNA helicase